MLEVPVFALRRETVQQRAGIEKAISAPVQTTETLPLPTLEDLVERGVELL